MPRGIEWNPPYGCTLATPGGFPFCSLALRLDLSKLFFFVRAYGQCALKLEAR